MKRIKKRYYFLIVAIVVALFLPQAQAGLMGFGPTEIIGNNKRGTLVIGTASLINNYDVAKYGVLSIVIPYINQDTWKPMLSEQRNIRVVCRACGDTMVRYEAIEEYIYPDSLLVGTCEKCGSDDLIFYELLPRDEFQQMSLEGAGAFELRREGNAYITTEKIPAKATCNINVLYDASTSYVKENEGKYWEVRVKATLMDTLDSGDFMVSGIGIRTLLEFKLPLFIDAPGVVEKGENFTVKVACGNLEGTWRKTPVDVTVSFFGETKQIDEDGCVTFMTPTTRENFEYDIVAEGSKYLSDTKIVVTEEDVVVEESNDGTSSILLLVGISIVLIIIVLVGYRSFKRKRKKELEG